MKMKRKQIHFIVPGQPVPKARARIARGRNGFYTPKKTVDYESLVAKSCKSVMGGQMPFMVGVEIITRFYIKIPKSWSKKKRASAIVGDIRPTSRPDFDNYLKSICDGLNGIAYLDDAQIVEFEGSLWYSDNPRAEVWLWNTKEEV